MSAARPPHDLEVLVEQASDWIAAEYDRIRRRSRDDPGTAGDQGEENWKALLELWLPSTYHVATKGRILTSSGQASKQMDVVVLSPGYPNGLLSTKLYLAAGVLAAFECKNTLRLEHIDAAFRRGTAFQQLARNDASVTHHILFGLLAHSHDVHSKSPEDSLSDAIDTADRRYVTDPRDCLDFVCIAALGTWTLMRMLFRDVEDSPFSISSTYMGPGGWTGGPVEPPPVGRFLTGLLRRLGAVDPTLAPIAEYFHHTGLFGMGTGSVRSFPLNELPQDLETLVW